MSAVNEPPRKLTDEEVEALLRIADNQMKGYRRHWYTLGIATPHYPSLYEQLDAISRLGESGNPRALEYLTELNETEGELCNPADRMDGRVHEWHPHAKGALYDALKGYYDGYGYAAGIPDYQRPDFVAKEIVREALRRLQASVE